jgi:uncharacterized integral membrane protein (TIGR00697 family)
METIWIALALWAVTGISLLGFFRMWGQQGLYVYMAIAINAANIQILKRTWVPFLEEPVALGTVVFTSLFLCNDLLQEFYGKAAAIRGIWVGFASHLLFTAFLGFGILYPPHPDAADPYHQAMVLLFTPAWRFFAASLISYVACQYVNTSLYALLRVVLRGRYLGFRNWICSFVGGVCDHVLFTVLAWYVFSTIHIDGQTLLWTYMIGAFIIRVMVSSTHVGFMYLARWMMRP